MPLDGPNDVPLGLGPPPQPPVTSWDDARVLQILAAEHSSLAAARALADNEAFTRVGMFLTFLSTSFVALALIAQATSFREPFLGIAAIVLTFDLVIGLVTFGRILGTTSDDLRAVHGMARVRHGYLVIAPLLEPYFTTGTSDDPAGVRKAYRAPTTVGRGVLYALTTSTGMMAIIVALIGGVLAGVLALIVGLGSGLAFGLGAVAALVLFGALGAAAGAYFSRDQANLEVRFPAPSAPSAPTSPRVADPSSG
jgi:hypothetical protein